MGDRYDAIIIGAGPGGMSCAALLAKRGMKMLVVDKNPNVGGLLFRMSKDGFTYDFGTMAGLPTKGGRWEALFRDLDIADKYKVVRHPMVFMYRDRQTREWKRRIVDWVNPLDPEPNFNLLGCPVEEREHAIKMLTELFMLTPEQLATLEETSIQELMERVKMPWAVTTMMYMFANGGSIHTPELVDASEMLPKFFSLNTGVAYPLGGFGRLSEILGERCKELGVGFKMKTRVERINIENGRVTGVTTKKGETIESPIVVSSAGIQATVLKLAGEQHFDKSYLNWVRDLIPGMSFTRCNYILSKPAMKHSYYQIFSDESWWNVDRYSRARDGDVAKDVTVSIVVNSNYDPSLAPSGKQILQVGTNATPDPKDPNVQLLWNRADDLVAEIFPEILPYIEKKENYIGPAQISARSRDAVVPGQGGEISGLAQIVGQVGRHKPKAESPVSGLFYVGVDAEGGPHMASEQAVDSALKVAPKVHKYHLKRISALWR